MNKTPSTERIGFVSDLHLDAGAAQPLDCRALDLLIVAGDLGSIQTAVDYLCVLPIPVVVVLGNHDYWTGGRVPMDERFEQWRAAFEGTNVHLLERTSLDWGSIRFLGATLWTDYGQLKPHLAASAQCIMNDFGEIAAPQTVTHEEKKDLDQLSRTLGTDYPLDARMRELDRVQPEHLALDHRKSCAWFEKELTRAEREGKTVIAISHHAPSVESLRQYGFKASQLEGALDEQSRIRDEVVYRRASYASSTGLLQRHAPLIWVHGHLHKAFQYARFGSLVLCNPRGYADNDVTHYQRPLSIHLADPSAALICAERGAAPAIRQLGLIESQLEPMQLYLKEHPKKDLAHQCVCESFDQRIQLWNAQAQLACQELGQGLSTEMYELFLKDFIYPSTLSNSGRGALTHPLSAKKASESALRLMKRGRWLLEHMGNIATEIQKRDPSQESVWNSDSQEFLSRCRAAPIRHGQPWLAVESLPNPLRRSWHQRVKGEPWIGMVVPSETTGAPPVNGVLLRNACALWVDWSSGIGHCPSGVIHQAPTWADHFLD